MRQQPDFFGDQELVLVYLAKRLREAKKVEATLDAAGADYLVEPDTYLGGFLFRSERIGAFFYAAPGDETRVREVLRAAGLRDFQPGGE